jgi:hypothetical protein
MVLKVYAARKVKPVKGAQIKFTDALLGLSQNRRACALIRTPVKRGHDIPEDDNCQEFDSRKPRRVWTAACPVARGCTFPSSPAPDTLKTALEPLLR